MGRSMMSTTSADKVLAEIKKAQENSRNGFAQALGEIRAGEKQSCWIWWVWPSLEKVRTTSRPQYSLPDLDAARQYLADPLLSSRLDEVTGAALKHLRNGVKPGKLFGGSTDAAKFHETATCFAVAAMESEDPHHVRIFLEVLEALGGTLEEKTMRYIVSELGLQRFKGIVTAAELSAMSSSDSVLLANEPADQPPGAETA